MLKLSKKIKSTNKKLIFLYCCIFCFIIIGTALSLVFFYNSQEPKNVIKLQAESDCYIFGVNEQIVFNDLKVFCIENSVKTELQSSQYLIDLSEVNNSHIGEYYVKIVYLENSQIYDVLKIQIIASRLVVTNNNTVFEINNIDYSFNEMNVQVVSKNNVTKQLSKGQYKLDTSAIKNEEGEYAVKIIYEPENLIFEFIVKVVYPYDEVKALQITNQRTVFLVGEEFSLGDAQIYKIYGDNTKNLIDNNEYEIDFSDYNKDIIGTYNIIIKYKGNDVTLTYQVEVIN